MNMNILYEIKAVVKYRVIKNRSKLVIERCIMFIINKDTRLTFKVGVFIQNKYGNLNKKIN